MSTVTVSLGSARSSGHVHPVRCPASLVTAKRQLSRSGRGVGPAESTGKSSVTYCPGGTAADAARLRPRNAREIGPSMCIPSGAGLR